MGLSDSMWLAADYRFPSGYSCRVPMSSMHAGLAMPAPSPATIRLALIRVGIEMLGVSATQHHLFPAVARARILVRPPNHVAFSNQILQAFKVSAARGNAAETMEKAPTYREVAQTDGVMTVYMQVPHTDSELYRQLFEAIGYWGTAWSFTCCVDVRQAAPERKECLTMLDQLTAVHSIGSYFACLVADFKSNQVSWEEIQPRLQSGQQRAIKVTIGVWPLVVATQYPGGRLLCHQPLP